MMPNFPPDDDDSPWERPSATPATEPPSTWVKRTRGLVLRHWQPQALPPPRVDPDLPRLSGMERSAEVFRYTFYKFEYWLSAKGRLREWVRFNIRLVLLLALPAFLVVPLITFALDQFTKWAVLLAQTSSSMVLFPLSALLVIGLICGVIYLARALQGRPRRHPHYFE